MRTIVFVSFIFLIAALAGCGQLEDTAKNKPAAKKPLAMPPSTGNRPKIIAFGDSLTAGFGLSEKESYPYLLQEKLKADGYDYEVVNAGVSGDTSLGGLERSDWVLAQENAKIGRAHV